MVLLLRLQVVLSPEAAMSSYAIIEYIGRRRFLLAKKTWQELHSHGMCTHRYILSSCQVSTTCETMWFSTSFPKNLESMGQRFLILWHRLAQINTPARFGKIHLILFLNIIPDLPTHSSLTTLLGPSGNFIVLTASKPVSKLLGGFLLAQSTASQGGSRDLFL